MAKQHSAQHCAPKEQPLQLPAANTSGDSHSLLWLGPYIASQNQRIAQVGNGHQDQQVQPLRRRRFSDCLAPALCLCVSCLCCRRCNVCFRRSNRCCRRCNRWCRRWNMCYRRCNKCCRISSRCCRRCSGYHRVAQGGLHPHHTAQRHEPHFNTKPRQKSRISFLNPTPTPPPSSPPHAPFGPRFQEPFEPSGAAQLHPHPEAPRPGPAMRAVPLAAARLRGGAARRQSAVGRTGFGLPVSSPFRCGVAGGARELRAMDPRRQQPQNGLYALPTSRLRIYPCTAPPEVRGVRGWQHPGGPLWGTFPPSPPNPPVLLY